MIAGILSDGQSLQITVVGTQPDVGEVAWTRIILYDEESDHSNKAVRKTPEIESGHKVSEEVKWT